jgi:hypothetical protein
MFMVKKKMHAIFRFLLKVPPVALYITKPKPASDGGPEGPPFGTRGVCGKLVIAVTLSIIVNICQVTKHPWGGQRNHRKFRSAL